MIFFLSVLTSVNVFAITSRFGFQVRSCGVQLILDMRQQSSSANRPMQQRQVLQHFEANTCDMALDDCDDERRQVQRQSPEQRGHLQCQIQQQDNDYENVPRNPRHEPKPCQGNDPRPCGDFEPKPCQGNDPRPCGDFEPKPRQGCSTEGPCCREEWACGQNPFYTGGSMGELMRYRKCLREIDACREGKLKDPTTGLYIFDDDK